MGWEGQSRASGCPVHPVPEPLPREAPGWVPAAIPRAPSSSRVGLGRSWSEDFEGLLGTLHFRTLHQEGGDWGWGWGAFHPPPLF